MQAQQPQYHNLGSGAQGNYPNQPSDIPQNTQHNYPPSYHSTYHGDVQPQYPNMNHNMPYNNQQMPYNPAYRPQMTHDMYNSVQQYPRNNPPHYPAAWDKDNQQNYGPPVPSQGGPICNNQSQMPPPPHHFSHHLQMSPSHSPRSWSMPQQSPRATPSPMAPQNVPSPSLTNRSPVTGKQFSPSPVMSSMNPAFEFQSQQASTSSPSPSSNHIPASSSPSTSVPPTLVDSSDPLQSLQKMVMIESQAGESPVERVNYEVSSNSSLPHVPLSKCASDFSNIEQLASNEDADSPGPTYYNLDDGRTVNTKVHGFEETSRGSYNSEHGVSEPHFSTVPPMEHMGYNHPVNGIPMEEQNSYHQAPHNGYPQHMYQQNPYCTNGTMQQRPPRKRPKKNAMNPDGPGKRKRKGKASSAENFNSNFYPGNMLPDYQTGPFDPNAPSIPFNGALGMNGPVEAPPVVERKKRPYTKRAKANKVESPAHFPEKHTSCLPGEVIVSESSADASNSETSLPTKRKYSPRQKVGDVAKSETLNSKAEPSFVNGPESPVAMSVSSFDGPVKITRIPNIIGNGERTIEDSDVSTMSRTSISSKGPRLKEVSVKIGPLPTRTVVRNLSSSLDVALKSENGFESVSNSPCSSNNSSVLNAVHQDGVKDLTENDSNSNYSNGMLGKRRRGRPKKAEGEQFVQTKKEKVVKSIEPKFIEARKIEDRQQKPLFGPYVHIEGSYDNPTSISIVNTQAKDEDKKISKLKEKKNHKHVSHSFNPKQKLGHNSTLSAGYDTLTKDKSWLCVFCHKGSHCDDLGDLYGPYYHSSLHIPSTSSSSCSPNNDIKTTNNCESDNSSSVSPNQRTSGRLRRRRLDTSESFVYTSPKSLKQGNSKESSNSNCTTPVTTPTSTPNKTEVKPSVSSSSEALQNEYWIHEECILWADGVYIIGHKLVGLDDAVKVAVETICSHCGESGATLGCIAKHCSEQLHFLCATEKGCILDDENFTVRCPDHVVIHMKERS